MSPQEQKYHRQVSCLRIKTQLRKMKIKQKKKTIIGFPNQNNDKGFQDSPLQENRTLITTKIHIGEKEKRPR